MVSPAAPSRSRMSTRSSRSSRTTRNSSARSPRSRGSVNRCPLRSVSKRARLYVLFRTSNNGPRITGLRATLIWFPSPMKRTYWVLLALAVAISAGAQTNPFLNPSPLPYQAPPFDKIKDADYQPAIEEGMKRQIAEVEAIANNSDPPTFDNTIVEMERSGDLLTRVAKVFFNLAQSNTNDTMQKIEAEESPKLAAHQDTIFLNSKLFARVK